MADSSLVFNIIGKDKTGPAFHSAGSNVEKLAGRLKTAFTLGAVYEGVKTVGHILGGLVSDARESAKVAAISANVVKSTGGAAHITAAQMGALATTISNKTGVDDEAIQSGENLLATFTGIRNEAGKGNDIFNQTSSVLVDMTAAMNDGNVTTQGLKSSSIQLGKALNDPAKGMTALTRVGVTFTDQQKEQVKHLVATGHTMDAQKVILKELNKEFGGTAAAATTPAQKATIAWGNLREQLGGYLLPVVDKVATLLSSKVIPAVSRFFDNVKSGGGKFAAFRSAMTHAFQVIKTDVLPVLIRLGTWIGTVLLPALGRFAQKLATDLKPALKQIGESIRTQVWPAVQQLIGAFRKAWPTISRLGSILLTVAGFILRKVLPVVIKLHLFMQGMLIRTLAKVITVIAKVVGKLIDFGKWVGSTAVKVWHFATAVGNAFMSAYHAVTSAISKAVSAVKAFPGNAVRAIGNLGSTLYQHGLDFIQGFINGIISKAKDLPGVIKDKVVGAAKSALHLGGLFGSPSRLTMKYGQWFSEGFAIGIKDKAADVLTSVQDLLGKLKDKLATIKEFRDTIVDSFRSATDISSFDGSEPGSNIFATLQQQADKATAFSQGFGALKKMGLNATTLTQLRDAGPDSLGSVQSIVAGGQGGVNEVNRLVKQILATGGAFADAETKRQFGTTGTGKQTVNVQVGKQHVHFTMDFGASGADDAFMAMMRKAIRAKGGNVQVVLGKGV